MRDRLPTSRARAVAMAALVIPLMCSQGRAWQVDGPDEQLRATRCISIVIGPVDVEGDELTTGAVAVCVQEELPRRLALGAGQSARVFPFSVLTRAAATLSHPQGVVTWGEARAASAELAYDRLVLVAVRCRNEAIASNWQVYDCGSGQATLAAGRLPGNMVDLDGFVGALTRRVGEALGGFEKEALATSSRDHLSQSNEAVATYFLGRAALERGDAGQALAQFSRCLALDEGLAPAAAYRARATCYRLPSLLNAGQAAVANELADSCLRATGVRTMPMTRAELLAAKVAACDALQLPQLARDAQVQRAVALVEAGAANAALEALADAERRGYADVSSAVLAARAQERKGDWLAAERLLKAAVAARSTNLDMQVALGELYVRWALSTPAGDTSAQRDRDRWFRLARASLERAAADPLPARAYLALAQACVATRDDMAARRAAERALRVEGVDALLPAERVTTLVLLAKLDSADPGRAPKQDRLRPAKELLLAAPCAPQPGLEETSATVIPLAAWLMLADGYLLRGDSGSAKEIITDAIRRFGRTPEVTALAERLPADSPPAEQPAGER